MAITPALDDFTSGPLKTGCCQSKKSDYPILSYLPTILSSSINYCSYTHTRIQKLLYFCTVPCHLAKKQIVIEWTMLMQWNGSWSSRSNKQDLGSTRSVESEHRFCWLIWTDVQWHWHDQAGYANPIERLSSTGRAGRTEGWQGWPRCSGVSPLDLGGQNCSELFGGLFPHNFVWGSCFWFCIPGLLRLLLLLPPPPPASRLHTLTHPHTHNTQI